MKPIVGVMPLWDEEKESLWMLPEYLDAIRLSGGIPVIFPFQHTEQDLCRLMDRCDGFLLTGGPDVSPELYGQQVRPYLTYACFQGKVFCRSPVISCEEHRICPHGP